MASKYDPTRMKALKHLHEAVFMGEEDYIPLIVNPPCPGRPEKADYWENVANTVERDAIALQPKVAVDSDWIPTVNVTVYQNILIPALFGAELVYPEGSDPICKPHFDNLEEACAAGVPLIRGYMVDRMINDLRATRRVLDNQYCLSFVVVSSPFDLALLLLGVEFLTGLIVEAELAYQFLSNLTDVSLQLIELVSNELGNESEGSVKSRGLFSPGYRLSCDAIVNFSPANIRDFVLPIIAKFKAHLGPMYIHFCTEPAPARHVLPVLLDSDAIIALDNWQGPEIFIGEGSPTELQSKITIVGDIDVSTPEKMETFFNLTSVRKVPRSGGRGLIMTTVADSVEDGHRIYAEWQARFSSNF